MKRGAAVASMLGAIAFPAVVRAQAKTKLRVIGSAIDSSGSLYYAQDLGFFDKAGLDVEIANPADNSLSIPTVVGGGADIGYVNVIQIEQAYKRGVPIAIVAPASLSNVPPRNTDYLLVPKDSPIASAKEFEGKTLGVSPLRSLGDYAVNSWIDAHGGDSTKIKWIEIPYPVLAEAMIAGRIDGAFSLEPYATRARATTRTFCHPFEVFGKPFVSGAFCANRAWATASADTVKRFVGAIHEACVWGNKNQAQSGAILAKYAKLDPATVAAMVRCPYPEKLDLGQFQVTVDFLAAHKMIDGAFPADGMFVKA